MNDSPISSDRFNTDNAHVYAIPLRNRFRGITVREGMLVRGRHGWGEFSPFADYSAAECVPWLDSAIEAAEYGWPQPVRDRVSINTTIPVVAPERAATLVRESGCHTAKVKVADPRSSIVDDCERVVAVREALGKSGNIRVDANGAWDVETAISAISKLELAADGLEYVEQPCPSITELAAVRRKVDVRIAADESIRRAEDPLRVAVEGAADVAVLKVAPLGGVLRALRVAEACGLPCVVSSAVETSIGLAAGLALAGALPQLDYACGLGTISLLEGDVINSPLSPMDGCIAVPSEPPEPKTGLLEATSASTEQRNHWLSRLASVRHRREENP